MGFGNGFTLKLTRPSFRRNLIDDMQSVAEGKIGSAYNASLVQEYSKIQTNVTYITRGGKLVAAVGATIVGEDEIVGYPAQYSAGG